MKKHWLRGMLLGVSLALLLAGGVALAQVTLTVDKDCIDCWEGIPREGVDPPASFIAEFLVSGLDEGELVCGRISAGGEVMGELECGPPPEGGTRRAYIYASCPEYSNIAFLFLNDYHKMPDLFMDPLVLGDWTFEVWQEPYNDGTEGFLAASAHIRIARVCQVEEFVPEPATIALLGSGLAGLAGYAALRWRARS